MKKIETRPDKSDPWRRPFDAFLLAFRVAYAGQEYRLLPSPPTGTVNERAFTRCPSCGDGFALKVEEMVEPGGPIKFKCFNGCSTADIRLNLRRRIDSRITP